MCPAGGFMIYYLRSMKQTKFQVHATAMAERGAFIAKVIREKASNINFSKLIDPIHPSNKWEYIVVTIESSTIPLFGDAYMTQGLFDDYCASQSNAICITADTKRNRVQMVVPFVLEEDTDDVNWMDHFEEITLRYAKNRILQQFRHYFSPFEINVSTGSVLSIPANDKRVRFCQDVEPIHISNDEISIAAKAYASLYSN